MRDICYVFSRTTSIMLKIRRSGETSLLFDTFFFQRKVTPHTPNHNPTGIKQKKCCSPPTPYPANSPSFRVFVNFYFPPTTSSPLADQGQSPRLHNRDLDEFLAFTSSTVCVFSGSGGINRRFLYASNPQLPHSSPLHNNPRGSMGYTFPFNGLKRRRR